MSSGKLPVVIGSNGITIGVQKLIAAVGVRAYKQIKQTFTIKEWVGIGKTMKSINHTIYKEIYAKPKDESTKLLILPRNALTWINDMLPDSEIRDLMKYPAAIETATGNKLVLDANQEKVVATVVNDILRQKGPVARVMGALSFGDDPEETLCARSCNLIMQTGTGKTYVGGALFREMACKTLVVTPNENITREWVKMCAACFPETKVGFLNGRKKTDGDIVIAIIKTLGKDSFAIKDRPGGTVKKIDYYKEFGMVIFDEVQKYTAPEARKVFWETNFRYAIGMTATPDEKNSGLDDLYKFHLGPLIVAADIDGYKSGNIKWTVNVRVIKYYGKPEHTKVLRNESTGYISSSQMSKQMSQDPDRNGLVIDLVKEYYDQGHNIFVFGDMRETLADLGEMITERLAIDTVVVDDKTVATIMGGVKDTVYAAAAKKSRVILTTYQYGAEGVSINKMDCIIFYTPRKSNINQTVGRIMRRDGDSSVERWIIDIVDCVKDAKCLQSQYSERAKIYKQREFRIEKETFRADDVDAS